MLPPPSEFIEAAQTLIIVLIHKCLASFSSPVFGPEYDYEPIFLSGYWIHILRLFNNGVLTNTKSWFILAH